MQRGEATSREPMTDDDKFRAIQERFAAVDSRLNRHDERLRELERQQTGTERSHEYLDRRLGELKEHIDGQVGSIRRPLNAAITAILLALIGGIMTFIMQGGLNAAG